MSAPGGAPSPAPRTGLRCWRLNASSAADGYDACWGAYTGASSTAAQWRDVSAKPESDCECLHLSSVHCGI
jgi:hypothetical protein